MKQILASALLMFFLSSCGLLGVHLKLRNPKHPAQTLRFDEGTRLLGELSSLRKNFDVTFYALDIRLDPAQKSLSGWVEIRAVALHDIDSIQLDLEHSLVIDGLRWTNREGLALNYSRNHTAVYVALPHKVNAGENFTLHVSYHGKPISAPKPPWDGGVVWKKDKQKNDWAGVSCESQGASIWFPCKDHTSDEPDSASMRFTVPDRGLTVVSNGVFQGSEKKDGFESFSWKVHYPINLYNITFYLGNFGVIEDSYIGIHGKKLMMSHYVLIPHIDVAARHFKQVKDHLRIYEELYGEYPWYKDGFKLVESPYEGMEHQSAIAYGSGFRNDLYGIEDYVMLHETGHEWFGNAVTAADLADVWLQEGVTTYGEVLYLEKKYGYRDALNHLLFYRLLIKNKRPVVGPSDRRYFDYHDSDAYVKGAWILHSLRNHIQDDSLFFSILRIFYEENKLKVTDSRTFIATVNRLTGEDYSWFFDQYLYHNKAPVLEYQYLPEGILYYRWTEVEDGFNKMGVPLQFSGSDFRYEVYPDKKVQVFVLPEGKRLRESSYFNDNFSLFALKKNSKLRNIYVQQEGLK